MLRLICCLPSLVESLNSAFRHARELPIVALLSHIYNHQMERFVERNQKAAQLLLDRSPLNQPPPTLRDKLRELIKDARTRKVTPSSPTKSLVASSRPGLPDRIVDAGAKTCTCHGWQISAVPCVHACAHFLLRGIDPLS